MERKYTFGALVEMTPQETRKIRDQIRDEYAEVVQQQLKHAAEVLFYQTKIAEAKGL